MTVQVGVNKPGLGASSQANIGRTVFARTMAALVARLNWVEGWLFRPQIAFESTPNQIVYGIPAATRSHRWLWFPEVESDFIFIAFTYRAQEPISGGAPTRVTASLHKPSTVTVVDLGCRWDLSSGHLALTPEEGAKGDDKLGFGELAHTGFFTNPEIDPTALSVVPRMLRLSTFSGADVELRLDAENVDVYTCMLWEAWRTPF